LPQLRDCLRGATEREVAGLPAAADLDLELALRQRPTPDRDADRAAQQLGVGELLPRAGVAIVVEDAQAGRLELLVHTVGRRSLLAALLAERDDLDVEWRDRTRP